MTTQLLVAISSLLIACVGPVRAEGNRPSDKPESAAHLEDVRDGLARLEAEVEENEARIRRLQARHEATQGRLAETDDAARIRKLVSEILADGQFRVGLFPALVQAGYDKGFYIKSADERFLLKVGGYTRLRWTGQNRQSENPRVQGRRTQDDVNGFEIEDLRLGFSGHIHSPRLTYRIVANGDTDAAHDWTTYSAWIDYEFAEELSLCAGLEKLPFGRQENVSKSALQFVDRSVANELFNLDRSIGAAAHGRIAGRLSYVLAVTNGYANPNDSPSREQTDTNLAYTARVVAHLLGEPIKTESDLDFSKKPRLETGLSFAYHDDNGDDRTSASYAILDRIRAGRGIGGHASADLTGTDLLQLGADIAYRFRGLSLTAEYWLRSIDSDTRLSPWERLTGRRDAVHQQGGYVQAGYFVMPRKLEVAARLGGVWDYGGDNVWEVALGMNYFPWGSRTLVLQTDYTRIAEAPSSSSSANWSRNDEIDMIRVQMVVRF